MNTRRSVTAATLLTSALLCPTLAAAQSPLVHSDAIEVKRIGAMATVQRLGYSARSRFDPQIATSAPGEKGCTFNIGDIQAAKSGGGITPVSQLGQPVERKALGRTEYITLVEATPICITR